MAVQVDWNAQLAIGLKKGNPKIIQTALEKGANVEKTFLVVGLGYMRPLEFAISKADVESVRKLLESNANIVRTTLSGRRIDARLFAENLSHANPSNPHCQEVAKLLNIAQHTRLFQDELTASHVNNGPRLR